MFFINHELIPVLNVVFPHSFFSLKNYLTVTVTAYSLKNKNRGGLANIELALCLLLINNNKYRLEFVSKNQKKDIIELTFSIGASFNLNSMSILKQFKQNTLYSNILKEFTNSNILDRSLVKTKNIYTLQLNMIDDVENYILDLLKVNNLIIYKKNIYDDYFLLKPLELNKVLSSLTKDLNVLNLGTVNLFNGFDIHGTYEFIEFTSLNYLELGGDIFTDGKMYTVYSMIFNMMENKEVIYRAYANNRKIK